MEREIFEISPETMKYPEEAWIIFYGTKKPEDWVGSFPSDHYQQYYTQTRNGIPHHFDTYEQAKEFSDRECLIDPIIIPIAGKYAMQMSEQNTKYELDGIHKNHLIQIIGRLVKICDRYEKERQGLYEDELVTLNDAKFQLRLSAKERGQKNI